MPDPAPSPAVADLDYPKDASAADRLSACKAYLQAGMERIKTLHQEGESGLGVAQARAGIIDGMLRCLFGNAEANYKKLHGEFPAPVALIALGGYGRGELSPFSDIDVMFLYPSKTKAATIKALQEYLTLEILYVLWDSGLKVGHSTRTVDEVFAEARKEIQTKTALLESRLIAGSHSLYGVFAQAYRSYYTTENPKGYILARIEDQAARRAKYGDSVFMQEPDIKNGVGGLRDYQNALWMARVKLGVATIAELATQQYLRESEIAEFNRAYNFLLRTRNELHLMVRHPTDVLSLDIQPRLALNLGYAQPNELERIERFMRDYYLAALTVYRVSKTVEDRLALSVGRGEGGRQMSFRESLIATRFLRTKRLDGFILRGRELAAEKNTVFEEDPARLIRVFRHCQQLDCTLDFHLAALIRESLGRITPAVVHSHNANVSFRAILAEAGAVFPALNRMHELGVLGHFLPEFDELTCLVQHEFYHRYTADVHTLNAIRELDLVFTEAEPISLKYRTELHETSDPTLLYVTLLLHDLGKAEGIRNHAESGVRIAEPILERLGIASAGRELVKFVIKNHLEMARFWQKRDVDDPHTATAFAEIVDDPEKLRHLYVHTFCDARGTAGSLWNSYKDTLHTTLFRATMEHLHLGANVQARHQERMLMTQQELITRKIPGIGADEITAHFGLLPERYFIHADTDEIALHIQMVNRLLKSIADTDSVGSLKPVIEWQDDLNRSLTVVNVVTWDRAGLFYKLAGALSAAGLSILGSRVISRSDHIAIDTFYVVEPGRGVVQSSSAQETFARTAELALLTNKDMYPEILAQATRQSSRYAVSISDAPHHRSFPPTVEVYHELSMERTIVEIQARDQIGLLYRLARAICEHGFNITFARIGTERGVAIDTFYIEGSDPQTPVDNPRLHALSEALKEIISPAAGVK